MHLDGQDYYRLGLHGTCLSGMDRWAKWEDTEAKARVWEKNAIVRLHWIAKSPTSPDPEKVRAVKLIAQARRAGQISEESYRSLLKKFT